MKEENILCLKVSQIRIIIYLYRKIHSFSFPQVCLEVHMKFSL